MHIVIIKNQEDNTQENNTYLLNKPNRCNAQDKKTKEVKIDNVPIESDKKYKTQFFFVPTLL